MDSELRNRKPAPTDPVSDDAANTEGLSSANKHHHHFTPPASRIADIKDPQEIVPNADPGTETAMFAPHSPLLAAELKSLPQSHTLTATHKENLAKDSEQTAYGKTPNGTIFRVPATKDMVSELFDLSKRKAGYNAGLGYLLKLQSDRHALVAWAKGKGIFDKTRGGAWYDWLKEELSCKMGKDYQFETAPLEYNTWLLYRQLVDLILMNDFTSYICFALSWLHFPAGSGFFSHVLRWIGGLVLVLFNIWVKLDAHRVVKDFAW
ncbi:phosphatidylethanolamine N-methyltransferase, partial [Dissophora globulifera]